jgi:hypothetical protein
MTTVSRRSILARGLLALSAGAAVAPASYSTLCGNRPQCAPAQPSGRRRRRGSGTDSRQFRK